MLCEVANLDWEKAIVFLCSLVLNFSNDLLFLGPFFLLGIGSYNEIRRGAFLSPSFLMRRVMFFPFLIFFGPYFQETIAIRF